MRTTLEPDGLEGRVDTLTLVPRRRAQQGRQQGAKAERDLEVLVARQALEQRRCLELAHEPMAHELMLLLLQHVDVADEVTAPGAEVHPPGRRSRLTAEDIHQRRL